MKFFLRVAFSGLTAVALILGIMVTGSAAQATVTPSSGPVGGGTSVTVAGIAFVSVQTGEDFSVGLTSEGTLYSWGRNTFGQLGNGSTTNSFTPVPVKGEDGVGVLSGVVDFSAGLYHVLALTTSGLYAWGDNSYGQLGDGTVNNALTPVRVVGVGGSGLLTGVTAVSGGGFHSMVLSSGHVYTWGLNSFGQLGINSTTDQNTPVQVLGPGANGFLSGVNSVSAGMVHNVVTTSTAVFSWGGNFFGQLGVGTFNDSLTPVQVLGVGGNGFFPSSDSITAGGGFTLALSGGNVYSWGNNTDGQLGDGTSIIRNVPVPVLNQQGTGALSGVSSIVAASYNSYAIVPDGVYVWGSNSGGGLCIDVPAVQTPFSSLPVYILGETGSAPLTNVLSISGGNRTTNIVTPSGIHSCGFGYYGQFGNGSTVDSARVTPGPRFEATGLSFGGIAGGSFVSSTGTLTALTPPGAVGAVNVIGTANVFGGTLSATPATVSWNAGTFTYEAALANTGAPNNAPLLIGSGIAVLLGIGLLFALRRENRK
jgi:LPXTG-motif cell wall-anchored protein